MNNVIYLSFNDVELDEQDSVSFGDSNCSDSGQESVNVNEKPKAFKGHMMDCSYE